MMRLKRQSAIFMMQAAGFSQWVNIFSQPKIICPWQDMLHLMNLNLWQKRTLEMGFKKAACGPYVRSSFHAKELLKGIDFIDFLKNSQKPASGNIYRLCLIHNYFRRQ